MYRNRNQRNDIVKLVDDRWVELHSPCTPLAFAFTQHIMVSGGGGEMWAAEFRNHALLDSFV